MPLRLVRGSLRFLVSLCLFVCASALHLFLCAMVDILNVTAIKANLVHAGKTVARQGAELCTGPEALCFKVEEVEKLVKNPAFKLSDMNAYLDAVQHLNTVGINDRDMLLEKVIVLMARLKDTTVSLMIQKFVINLLYKDLPHPPGGYLCLPNTKLDPQNTSVPDIQQLHYAFRPADGSNCNPLMPSLGKAGSPYARSVPSTRTAPRSALPDPGLVFDSLLRRDSNKFTPHPGGISALFFAFADLVIHSIFDTNSANWAINNASSYLDLSILYGNTDDLVASVRRGDGTGRLWDDVFGDKRLLLMPPASCALLVLLCRNHNYIADKILAINEQGTLSKQPPTDEKARQAQDDEIFHRSRLVNCGFFMQIILGDYVGAILGLVRDQSDWRLDPLMTMREMNHEIAPRGEGNVVSLEFNLLYRWHTTLSEKDAEWTREMLTRAVGGADVTKISVQEFKDAAKKNLRVSSDVKSWTFNGLQRGPDGRFDDADLARILQDSTGCLAGAFQARGTPEAMRVIEMLAIEQSRSWGACSMNEFRKFLGLKPYSTFQEWNPDPEIFAIAEILYRDIDNLELHVGLQAEETKPPGPGAGLCPGYTISRAILADAVSLTRGDRFLTVDFTPFNCTAWGYGDCQFDTSDGSYGGLLTKLLFRHLPQHYPARSAYAHFPFLETTFMQGVLDKAGDGLVNEYIWTRPHVPTRSVAVVQDFGDVESVLSQSHSFLSTVDERLFVIGTLALKKTISDVVARTMLAKGQVDVRTVVEMNVDEWTGYLKAKVQDLVRVKSFTMGILGLRYTDIVRDVINLLPVHLLCEKIMGLPLKSVDHPNGTLNEQDVYSMFANPAQYTYMSVNPVDDWHLRGEAQKACNSAVNLIEGHLKEVCNPLNVLGFGDGKSYERRCHAFLKQAVKTSHSATNRELAVQIFTELAPTAAIFSESITRVIDFFLADERKADRAEIVRLASTKEKDGDREILTYVREALRLDPPVFGVYRTATAKSDQLNSLVGVTDGQLLFASIVSANLDPSRFGPDATAPDYARADVKPGLTNVVQRGLMLASMFDTTVPVIVGTILSLKNLERAPGMSGHITQFTEEWHGVPSKSCVTMKGSVSLWSDSMVVQFAG